MLNAVLTKELSSGDNLSIMSPEGTRFVEERRYIGALWVIDRQTASKQIGIHLRGGSLMDQGSKISQADKAVEEGLAYLRGEIDWHRRAGRLLFAFVIGAVGSSILAVREELPLFSGWLSRQNASPWEFLVFFVPILVPAGLSVWGGIHFFRYFKRISRLKIASQEILGHRISDEFARGQWDRAFGK